MDKERIIWNLVNNFKHYGYFLELRLLVDSVNDVE